MSETAQVAKMAHEVSTDIFDVFGWKQIGPTDHDWDCSNPSAHNSKTHPSDLVMWYDDPYVDSRIVMNFDLKSYALGSLSKPAVRKAITSLSKATDCANVSAGWRDLYDSPGDNYHVHGLLFIYNHDGKYDGDFDSIYNLLDTKDLPLNPRNRVHILSPASVVYLVTVAHDIEVERGRRSKGGSVPKFNFYYPDLVESHPKSQNQNCASIEMLQSPWQIVRASGIQSPEQPTIKTEYIVYYRGNGESVDEFKFLIDALFRYQMVGDDESITIKMPHASSLAGAKLQQAKDAYAADFFDLKEFRTRLQRISISSVKSVRQCFSTTILGMDYE